MDHALRTIRSTMHGFAMLEASRGFQWEDDPDESFAWMIRFIDRGLRDPVGGAQAPGANGRTTTSIVHSAPVPARPLPVPGPAPAG